jgi:type I restriction enzyme S subunit
MANLNLVPKGWAIKDIESVLVKVIDYRGKSPPKSDSGVPLITAKNIRKGYINKEPREYIPTEKFESWMIKGLPENGDIFITTEAPLGNVARVPKYLFAIGQRVLTLRVKKETLSSEFLLHVMQGQEFRDQLDLQSTGSTVAGIKQSTFRKMLLELPPLPEQQKIAAILTSVDEVIEKTQAQIDKLKDLKTAMMQTLLTNGVGTKPASADAALNNSTAGRESYIPHTEFKDSPVGRIPKSWEVVSFGQHLDILSGKGFLFNEYSNSGLKLLRIDNVSWGKIKWGAMAYLPETYASDYPKLVLKEDDILLALNRPITQGKLKLARIAKSDLPSILYQRVGKVIFKDKRIDNEFSYYLLLHWLHDFLVRNVVGSDQPFINISELKTVQFALPNTDEQQAIAESLIKIDNLIALKDSKFKAQKNIKKALMQDLLTGKVRVKVD